MSDLSNHPLGIFDSGIGGLTVVREMIRLLPQESLIYFGDTARVPYGTKSDRAVREFAWEDTLFLLGLGVKLIVIACNTASAVALTELQNYLKVSVIGVIEPGAAAAVSVTRNRRIGVIGTQTTVESGSYEAAVKRLLPDASVFSAACPLFVPLVEEGWLDGNIPAAIAQRYLEPLLAKDVDTLILGCTHYPLLKTLLSQVARGVTLVDSATETAKQVAALLTAENLHNTSARSERRFFVSDLPRHFETIGETFLGAPLQQVSIAEPWKSARPIPVSEQH